MGLQGLTYQIGDKNENILEHVNHVTQDEQTVLKMSDLHLPF